MPLTATGPARTLSRIVAVPMVVVAVGLTVCLIVFFAAKYLLDVPTLRRATLEYESTLILDLIGKAGAAVPAHYLAYPDHYAFRVFDRRDPQRRRLVVAYNTATCLDSIDPLPGGAAAPELEEGMEAVRARQDESGACWILTDRDQKGGHTYWIQVAMTDDPAWRWRRVIGQELFDHVMVPVLLIVPALTLAMILTTRHALQPLLRVARQAAELGGAVASGGAVTPLSANGLPREFRDVVAAINALLARLERTRQLQRQFTSDAAHELRTPLAVLQLAASRLPAGEARDHVAGELGALVRLVNQLLRFAQAEAAMALTLEAVDLSGCAHRVCCDLAPVAAARGAVIDFEAPRPVVVPGNAALVDAAIRNILDNAISVAPPDSSVVVQVAPGGRVVIDDRGPGVPDAEKERIFDRLWHAEHRQQGTGIGLALVRRIAQLHGGEVWVEDRPGGGARFVLTLAG